MSRMYIAVILLILLLTAGILLTAAFCAIHLPLSQLLDDAADAALRGDWTQALSLTAEASGDWERIRHFTAAVADHEPLEQMDALFSQLEPFAAAEDRINFAAVCSQLAAQAAALSQSQTITWWNLL